MIDDLAYRKALADRVLVSLSGVPAEAVRLLASGLRLVDGPLAEFSQAFAYYAAAMGEPNSEHWLATLRMARALQVVARDRRCDELLERLEAADVPPWPQLAAALTESRRCA